VGSLVVASVIALWGSTGLISVSYLNANFICILNLIINLLDTYNLIIPYNNVDLMINILLSLVTGY
jgi:hypothetical protein